MKMKIIGIMLLTCAGLIFQYCYDDVVYFFLSPCAKLKTTIEKDILNSIKLNIVENEKDIHHVQFYSQSKDIYNFSKKYPLQLPTKETGKIWLEIEIIDLLERENPGFIIQTSIFNLKTKNKVSEFGQTYYLSDVAKTALTCETFPVSTQDQ